MGSDVVATGSGPLDLTGLSFTVSSIIFTGIVPVLGEISTGPHPVGLEDFYSGVAGPAGFGSSGGPIFADSGSGDSVGIHGNLGLLGVPLGYVSGTDLSDTMTFFNQSFATLGVTPGTYVWTWGTGPNQNFTLIIGAAAVPEPASAALLGTALAGLLLAGARRRSRPPV